jgi:metal-sulfur cluster biosynthetic enzyme
MTAAERRDAVLATLDAIIDPCSRGLGHPVGLVGMGMIDRLDIDADRVSVTVLPTFPNCLFRGVIEAEIESRLGELPWCRAVSVHFAGADLVWDESRLSDEARRTLGRLAP